MELVNLLSFCSSPVLLDLPLPLSVSLLSVLLLFPLQLHPFLLETLALLRHLPPLLLLPQLLLTLDGRADKQQSVYQTFLCRENILLAAFEEQCGLHHYRGVD